MKELKTDKVFFGLEKELLFLHSTIKKDKI
jgi:hypothetical protein